MKKMKRIFAAILTLCILLSLAPPIQITQAAQTIQRYELDTDGIDAGATYLIVNASSTGSKYASGKPSTMSPTRPSSSP